MMICCSGANEGTTTGNEQTHSAMIMTATAIQVSCRHDGYRWLSLPRYRCSLLIGHYYYVGREGWPRLLLFHTTVLEELTCRTEHIKTRNLWKYKSS
jgi:hypothetical protein